MVVISQLFNFVFLLGVNSLKKVALLKKGVGFEVPFMRIKRVSRCN